jgi:hypothetical protein
MTKKGQLFILPLFVLSLFAGCSAQNHELVWENTDPFYQQEQGGEGYAKKTALDRTLQLDPGERNLRYSPSFIKNPPRRIAVMPFENLEGGNFKLNWIPITGRGGEEEDNWSWTYVNRLRKSFFAYLSLREFELLSLMETDTVMQELGITDAKKLYDVDPRDLAAALGVDAVIYGKMTNYSAKYLFLYTQVAVGLSVRCVSGEDGSDLFIASEVRRDNKFRIAISPIDLIVTAAQNTMNIRKLHLARAADEVCREVVATIPVSKALVKEKEAYWKDYVASSAKIQDIKQRISITGGDETVLLADGSGDSPQLVEDNIDAVATFIKSREVERAVADVAKSVQLAHAGGGTVRATENVLGLDQLLGESSDFETTSVNAGNNEGFAYVASASEPVLDEILHFNWDDSVEVARADVLYSSSDRGETIEIDASEIIYSNTGVMAESPMDGADTQDESEFFGSEDILQDIIDISVSDIIYSDNKPFPNDPAS